VLASLEAILRIEQRFDVQRAVTDGWSPDVVLVDAALMRAGRPPALDVPAVLLAGTPEDAAELMARLPTARGWVLKDGHADDLVAAVDAASGAPAAGKSVARDAILTVAAGAFGATALFFIWSALAP
jgi:hypothetical protein